MRQLNFELVPKSMWYSNLRKILPVRQWNMIKRGVRTRSGYRCEICGRSMEAKQLDTHETWEYDDEKRIQKLKEIRCLCKNCHSAIHIGNARVMGIYIPSMEWYCSVNGISLGEGLSDEQEAFDQWTERSRHKYTLDIDKSIISDIIGEEPIIDIDDRLYRRQDSGN